MYKHLLNFLLFLCIPILCFGQITDSTITTNSSITADSSIVKIGNKPKATAFIIPAVFIGYGMVSLAGDNVIRRLDYTTNAELQEDHPTFAQKVDNYSRYIPVVAAYGLDFFGIKAKHNFIDRSAMLLMSTVIAQASVAGVKNITHRMRPNGTNNSSFPSGHTSMAFMSAEFLHQEYKDQSIWYSIGGYTIATGTGILRLYNNAHWVSDVVAGAGIGILSTKVSYWVYPYIKRKLFHGKPINMVFSPGYQDGKMCFNLVKQF